MSSYLIILQVDGRCRNPAKFKALSRSWEKNLRLNTCVKHWRDVWTTWLLLLAWWVAVEKELWYATGIFIEYCQGNMYYLIVHIWYTNIILWYDMVVCYIYMFYIDRILLTHIEISARDWLALRTPPCQQTICLRLLHWRPWVDQGVDCCWQRSNWWQGL